MEKSKLIFLLFSGRAIHWGAQYCTGLASGAIQREYLLDSNLDFKFSVCMCARFPLSINSDRHWR